MKTSTKQQILSYLEGRQFVASWQIEDMSPEWASKASTIARRLRELHAEGKLERKLINGIVWYKRVSSRYVSDDVIQLANQLFETPQRFNANPKAK